MSDTAKAWIEERRAIIHGAREAIRPAEAIDLGLIDLPRALKALEAVNAQIDRMEADANTYGDGGHDLACDALFAYVMTLRQAIEGAINEQ